MPTYDYRCAGCEHTWEAFHGVSGPGPERCPRCGRSDPERQIGSGGAVLFKGEGFRSNREARRESKFVVRAKHPRNQR